MPGSRPRAQRVLIALVVPATLLCAMSFASASAHAAPVAADSLSYFTDSDGVVRTLSVEPAPAVQRLVTTNAGQLASGDSFTGGGAAADFPAYDGASTGQRAVVAMTNTTATDVLTPAAKPFTFGADINSDAVSTGSIYDNGNNILQRGLFGDAAQYKIQIDHGQAMCRVRGDGGTVSVTSTQVMPTGRWFHISCTRKVVSTGDKLVLEVTPITAQGTLGAAVITRSGIKKIGRLNFALATPVSVGGKLTSATGIHTESDQFNGLIDNPAISIG